MASVEQNYKGISQHNPNNTSLANTKLVSSSTQTYSSKASHHQQWSFRTTEKKPETPPIPTTEASGFSLGKEYIKTHKLSQPPETIILASWRKVSKSRYVTILKKWKNFSCRRKIDPSQPNVTDVADFIIEIYNSGIGMHLTHDTGYNSGPTRVS